VPLQPRAVPSHDGAEPSVDEHDIWRLATALSKAVTVSDVATALAEHGAPAAGASFSNMAVLDRDTNRVRVARSSVMDRDIAERWAEFDLSEPTPLCEAMLSGKEAMLSGKTVLLGSAGAVGERFPAMLADTRPHRWARWPLCPCARRTG
jgi:hypothetical protein